MKTLARLICAIVILTALDAFGGSAGAAIAQGEKPAGVDAKAAQEARAKQAAERIVQWMESMPLVAKAMTAADVESLFARVSLLPTTPALEGAFGTSLAAAVAASDVSRSAFNEGALRDARSRLGAAMLKDGYLTRADGAIVKELRAEALAIDLALIDGAAATLAPIAQTKQLTELAKCVRRADAAAQTMVSSSIPLPFITVAPASAALATLDDRTRAVGGALLVSDAATRADLGERLSFAYFDGTILSANETALLVQKANRDQPEEQRVEGMELTGIAMTIQLGEVYAAASKVMRINASLEQAVSAQLTPFAAFSVISALDRPQPSRAARGVLRTVSELESAALALTGVTPEQSKSISDIATAWRLEDMPAGVAQIQVEADLMADLGSHAATVVASDPKTWKGSADESDRAATTQLSQKRKALLDARTAASARATTAISQILGSELAAQLTPAPKSKSTPTPKSTSPPTPAPKSTS